MFFLLCILPLISPGVADTVPVWWNVPYVGFPCSSIPPFFLVIPLGYKAASVVLRPGGLWHRTSSSLGFSSWWVARLLCQGILIKI